MHLSAIGEIAKIEWLKTFNMRPDMKLRMGDYMVMPSHFHAIIRNTPHSTNQYGPLSKNLASKLGYTRDPLPFRREPFIRNFKGKRGFTTI